MKSTIKSLVRPLWRLAAPIRRPIVRKFDQHMIRLFDHLPRAVEAPPAWPAPVVEPPADLELLLNSVVRELARLQMQVEVLQEKIDDLQASDRGGARLSVVGEAG